jgi:hypothetical protein
VTGHALFSEQIKIGGLKMKPEIQTKSAIGWLQSLALSVSVIATPAMADDDVVTLI